MHIITLMEDSYMSGISRVAFTLFGFPVYWYGALIASGMLLGVLLASAREKRYGQKRDTVLNFVLIAIPAALICARLYYVAFRWKEYAANPMEIFNVRNGGMAIYGGVIGGILTGVVYTRINRVSFAALADLCAPALALGQAIGRWGNFFNQEAFGDVILSPALQFFPVGVYIDALSEWHYATFFYESVWCFLIVAGLLIGEKKGVFRRRGDVFLWYILAYAAERMVVEGMRTDSLYLGGVRISQLLSAGMLIGTAVIFLARAWHAEKKPVALIAAFSFSAVLIPVSLRFLPTYLQALHALILLGLGASLYNNTRRKL